MPHRKARELHCRAKHDSSHENTEIVVTAVAINRAAYNLLNPPNKAFVELHFLSPNNFVVILEVLTEQPCIFLCVSQSLPPQLSGAKTVCQES